MTGTEPLPKQVLHTVWSRTSSFNPSRKSVIIFRWVTNWFSLVLICPEHDNDHYPPSSTKILNWLCYTSAPLICLHGIYRDKCTFLQICYCKNIHYVRSQTVFISIFSAIFLKKCFKWRYIHDETYVSCMMRYFEKFSFIEVSHKVYVTLFR